jgi:hypothetical protein
MDDPDILFAIVILVIVAIVNSLHLDHCDHDVQKKRSGLE